MTSGPYSPGFQKLCSDVTLGTWRSEVQILSPRFPLLKLSAPSFSSCRSVSFTEHKTRSLAGGLMGTVEMISVTQDKTREIRFRELRQARPAQQTGG